MESKAIAVCIFLTEKEKIFKLSKARCFLHYIVSVLHDVRSSSLNIESIALSVFTKKTFKGVEICFLKHLVNWLVNRLVDRGTTLPEATNLHALEKELMVHALTLFNVASAAPPHDWTSDNDGIDLHQLNEIVRVRETTCGSDQKTSDKTFDDFEFDNEDLDSIFASVEKSHNVKEAEISTEKKSSHYFTTGGMTQTLVGSNN